MDKNLQETDEETTILHAALKTAVSDAPSPLLKEHGCCLHVLPRTRLCKFTGCVGMLTSIWESPLRKKMNMNWTPALELMVR